MSESKPREAALRGLVDRGVLSPAQAEEVRIALDAAAPGRGGVRWMEIAGYIGGGLVLAGAVALAAASWEELSDDARIALLAVLAVVAVGAAVFMAGGPHRMRGRSNRVPTVRRRIAGVLLALASALGAFAVGVAVDGELMYLPPLVGLAIAAAGYAALPSAVGQVTVWGMGVGLVGSLVEEIMPDRSDYSLVLGAAWMGLGLVWAVLSSLGVAAERRLGLGLGAGLALAACQTLLAWSDNSAWGYGSTLAVAALCIAYYTRERAAVLLVLGIAGVTVGVPELVWDVTDGAIAVAAVLLLAGAVLLVASWLGLLLHRRNAGNRPPPGAAAPGQGPPEEASPAAGGPAAPPRSGPRSGP
ncbi:DUF2157 domain-containing protein [Streptomonospora litoralis]|uniref:DUF2157 domain-containing protein n=1 Tax=Streptomonospora litoralis TaxID=2498135 RepID=A0A4P6Q5X4_9ACTN|nr:DUF2157 domain-containing protein [Streptomonospora litoralis]QBI54771.1 hypothetical protein EKD16_14965 [Streptomonospora litoralis]